MAGPSSPAQSPGGVGNIDVKPSDLWSVSGRSPRNRSTWYAVPTSFWRSWASIPMQEAPAPRPRNSPRRTRRSGNRWLEVWGRSVLSVGGVAVGFTETANTYTRADVASHPKPGKTAEQRPRPTVIDKAPNFGSVPDIKWGTTTAATTSCAA